MTLELTFTLIGVCRVVTGIVGVGLIAASIVTAGDDAPPIGSAFLFIAGGFLLYAGIAA